MGNKPVPSQHEVLIRDGDFIVSKTDISGRITYCNPSFISYSGYDEVELLNKPHRMIRHPDMPRTVFHLLWETIKGGREFHGFVKNLRKDGSFYWVFANVTPSYKGESNEIIGYHSVRRKPDRNKLKQIVPLYEKMLAAEIKVGHNHAIEAGAGVLNGFLSTAGKSYREYILTL